MIRSSPFAIWLSFSLVLACGGPAASQADAGPLGAAGSSDARMDAGATTTTDASSGAQTGLVAQLLGSPSVGKVDLLFMIDNSISMSARCNTGRRPIRVGGSSRC